MRDAGGTPRVLATAAVTLPRVSPTRAKAVEGFTDGLRGIFVEGWAYDPEAPETPVAVELLCDDKVIAEGVASAFRRDLAEAGKGKGRCAFSLRIPTQLLDGRSAELTVRECATGAILGGQPVTLGAQEEVGGEISGLEGPYVTGWVSGASEIEVWVDGEWADRCLASEPRPKGGQLYRARLPERFLDGRPHEIVVSVPNVARIAGAMAAITPIQVTPFDALQKHAGNLYLKGYLSPLGPRRYESLRKRLLELEQRAAQAKGAEAKAVLDELVKLVHGHEQVLRGFQAANQAFAPISFPVHEKPAVSIVIPVHNKFAVTYTCLASLAAALNKATCEVIIVDDGSSDETAEIEKVVSGVTVVRHKTAQGFVLACNAGGEKARGEYVLMLNNDTEVMSGWLDELLEPFSRFANVGMTGAKLIYPDGSLQEAGGIVWGNGQPWNVGRNGNPYEPRYNYVRQVDYLSGACIMLPTALWKKLQGFDRHFAPAYYEDTDLAFRVRAAGYKTVYTPFCEVVHYEGVSNGTSTAGSGLKRFQAINEPKFRARWAAAFRNNGVVGRDTPHLAQDRNVHLRALVLDAQTLTPDMDAGSYAAMQEIRLLQSLGFKVTFVPANIAYMGGYTEALQRMGVEVLYAPFALSMSDVIERRGAEFNLVYIARYGVAQQVIDTVRAKAPNAKVVLNIHDLHFLREVREALHAKDGALMQKAVATRDAELAVMRKVDLVVSYSDTEHAVIESHNLDSTRVARVPWVVETADKVPGYEARKDIAFLGGFGHRPNVEAVEWFVREVMPLIRERLPGVRLLVYGSRAPESLKALEAPDVVLKGFVKTTEEVYDSARIFVAPLLTGAGLKGKVIGAFARGIPTVMTPTAAEGTGATHGQQAMVVTKPGDWAAAIARLYKDRSAWQTMSERARELARDHYSFAKGQEEMLQLLEAAGVFTTLENQALWSQFAVN
ncbi:MAG: hypothetical protein A3G81_16860 [Betaproteobacteria bacterium RIFCSPLOWO2_12_FULL_65_14]|nr:MAG: hypothetical protein A3G81_16860 [Betaproteobacteria bacterium RIFCSPLOWO2_12_FULL_65_14]